MSANKIRAAVVALSGPLLGSALVLGGVASAQEVYGARAQVTRESFEQGRNVQKVSQAQADERAAGNVGDALEDLGGVTVQRTASGSATPILRGLTGYQVLLMLDELRLNDSLTRAGGSATLNLVDPESLARIEVIRGPVSVLYGSDALGGVVHVRTRTTGASEDAVPSVSGDAYARGASAERSARVQGSMQAAAAPMGLRLSAARGHAGAVRRGDGQGAQPYTGHDDWSASAKVEAALARRHRVTLSYNSGHLFDMPRSDVSTPEDEQRTVALDRDSAVLSYKGRLLQGRLRLHAFVGSTLRREHRERLRPGRKEDERERVLGHQLGLRASFTPWQKGSIELGAESSIERIGSTGERTNAAGEKSDQRGRYVDDSKYDMHALYALWSQLLARRTLLLIGARGTLVRVQAPTDPLFADLLSSGSTLDRRIFGVVGSVGVRQQLAPEINFVASLLSGFRAPNLEDFQAFGGGARGVTVPNPNLDEERSYTLETGIELQRWGFQVDAYAFASFLRGLVVRVPGELNGDAEVDGEPVMTRKNASRSILAGGELGVAYNFRVGPYIAAAGSWTWGTTQRPNEEGETIKEPASKVPPLLAATRVGFRAPGSPYFGEAVLRFQLSQDRLSEGDRADVRLCPDDCTQVDGFAELTLRAGVRLEHIMVVAAVENVLDSLYRTYASGASAPGRNFVVATRGTF